MKEKFNVLYEFIRKTIHGKHSAEFYDTVLNCVCSYNRNQKTGSDGGIIAWLYYGYGICCDERDHADKQTDDHQLKRFASDLYLNLIEVPNALSRDKLRRKYHRIPLRRSGRGTSCLRDNPQNLSEGSASRNEKRNCAGRRRWHHFV